MTRDPKNLPPRPTIAAATHPSKESPEELAVAHDLLDILQSTKARPNGTGGTSTGSAASKHESPATDKRAVSKLGMGLIASFFAALIFGFLISKPSDKKTPSLRSAQTAETAAPTQSVANTTPPPALPPSKPAMENRSIIAPKMQTAPAPSMATINHEREREQERERERQREQEERDREAAESRKEQEPRDHEQTEAEKEHNREPAAAQEPNGQPQPPPPPSAGGEENSAPNPDNQANPMANPNP
ncbi:MAG: hypothetical protein P4M08_07915 [Oligoflexia bacterium]|nr:hypothetical protein [Oligoflexia bacterium]